MVKRSLTLTFAFLFVQFVSNAQLSPVIIGQDTTQRPLVYAVPFLTISPDSRGAALGDIGAATSPDDNSIYWNMAKLPFATKNTGLSVNYTPWLRNIADDMALYNVMGYKKVTKNDVVGFGFTYFNLGMIEFRDVNGNANGEFPSSEMSLVGSYSRRLGRTLAMGINLKYVRSNLAGTGIVNNIATRPGQTVAGDIGIYRHEKPWSKVSDGTGLYHSWGIVISNLGGKMNYGGSSNFIPTNLRVGTNFTYKMDQSNKISFLVDLNKLLVPTPPIYGIQNGQRVIVRGKDPDRSPIDAVFSSFYDAPDGMSEEIREINYSIGAEYSYNDIFSARAGYFLESQIKGDRKYFTAGIGAKIRDSFHIDFAYLVPSRVASPLANTFRVSLGLNVGSKTFATDEDEDKK